MSRLRHPARTSFYALSVAVVLWAGVAVPLPYVEVVPGRPTSIAPLVEIDGVELTELVGDTAILTIVQQQRSVLGSLSAFLDRDRDLLPVQDVFPTDVPRDAHLAAERERFGRQFDVAAAVGARSAGVEVELRTEVVVVDVAPGSPAEGLLLPGDLIVAVDGEPVRTAETVQERTGASSVGTRMRLEVVRSDEAREVVVTLADVDGSGQARLGVRVLTAVDELVLPFEVRLRAGTRIGGPSAGLMIAVTVHDLLSDEDLLRGRSVMGTGTIDALGRIGPVGGVPHKMQAAANAGADLVLVPASQLSVAQDAAPDGLRVIGVATLDDALEVLRGAPA